MRKIFLLSLLIALSFSGRSQTNTQDLDIIRAKFQKGKTELVKSTLKIGTSQGKKFWPVYDQFEAKRVEISRQRLVLMNTYLKDFDRLTGKAASELTGKLISNDESLLALKLNYLPTFVKLIGGMNTAKFYQLEDYLQNSWRLEVQDQIPFIDKLENAN